MNTKKSLVIIRSIDDIDNILHLLPIDNKIEVKTYLEEYANMYEQFAFSIETGMIVAAKINNNLSITPAIIKSHFEIDKYEIAYNGDSYRVCVYDYESGEILVSQDNISNDIKIAGNILYDKINLKS